MVSDAGPRRGDVWWAELPMPQGSEPGFRRPVLIVQADAFNRSRIQTVIVAAITSNAQLGEAPGNVLLPKRAAGLARQSVVNVSQLLSLDRAFLTERAGRLTQNWLDLVDAGLRKVLGL